MNFVQSFALLLGIFSNWLPSSYYGLLYYGLYFNQLITLNPAVFVSANVKDASENGNINKSECDVESKNCENDNNDGPWWKNEDMKLMDMWKLLNCGEVFEDDRPIHNESIWALVRGAYVGVVGPDESTFALNKAEKHAIPGNFFGNGFKSGSIEVKLTDEKGRAVYATSPFRKGELVWSDDFTACFRDGMTYRKFLASIPSDLACDVFEWAYSGPSYGACVDLDEGSLINHAASTEANQRPWEVGNVKPNIGIDEETDLHVALSDINPGDELLIDYMSFADLDAWQLLGLGEWGIVNDVE